MKAEILSVGTELLLGDIVNTNAQYLSKRLAEMGILVYHQAVVGDNPQRLKEAFEEAHKRSDMVITTGGLGPTKDDLTKEVAAEYFDKKLVVDENALNGIREYMARMNRAITEAHKKQAYFPEGAVVFYNAVGTAPGCATEKENKIIINLPGPPGEMKSMFEKAVVPYLAKYQDGVLVSRVLRIAGIGESTMAERVDDIISGQSNPTVAPYAKETEVTLRITARAASQAEGENLITPVEEKIRERLGDNIFGEGETSLEEETAKLLLGKKLTLSVAESCTGGLVAAKLINYPGVSAIFMEGAVTYSNDAKIRRLGVKEATLESFGAVSEETVREMAAGIARSANTDIGLAITGIAGPGGETPGKPVGLVFLGLYIKGEVKAKKINLPGNRNQIRNRAAVAALDWLRRELGRA